MIRPKTVTKAGPEIVPDQLRCTCEGIKYIHRLDYAQATMSVFLAYDGSLNGDWIGRYAVSLAVGTSSRTLNVLHVEDANVSGPPLHQRLERLETLAHRFAVAVQFHILAMHDGVFGGLDAHLPKGPEVLVVCGARASAGRRGVLSGTISEQLLRGGGYNVLAIRVLQPGLLGVPRRVLLPLSTNDDAKDAVPFLKPMMPALERLDLLRCVELPRRRYANLTEADAADIRHRAQATVDAAEDAVIAGTGLAPETIDCHVRVTDDWAKQTAIEAGRYRTGLILAGLPSLSPAPLTFAHPMEELMRNAPTDVAAYRSAAT